MDRSIVRKGQWRKRCTQAARRLDFGFDWSTIMAVRKLALQCPLARFEHRMIHQTRHVPRSYRIGVGAEKTRETRESVGLSDRWLTILGFSARTIWITGHPVEEIKKNQKILKVTIRAELIIHNTCAVTGTISFFCCDSNLRLLRTELTVCSSKNCSSLWCDARIL